MKPQFIIHKRHRLGTLEPLRIAPASSLPHANTCPKEFDLTTSHIGKSKGFEKSLLGGWSESIASNK